MSESKQVRISAAGAAFLREMAADAGVTPRQYLEALLHHAGSVYHRPGSWEANQPFSISTYEPRENSCADRWFE